MIFRQLLHQDTSTYTYLIGDAHTNKAVIIDPVKEEVKKYLELINKLDLELVYSLDTHVHADHITGSGALREEIECEIVSSKAAGLDCADIYVEDNDTLEFGRLQVEVISTPGHTDHDVSYLIEDRVFTGDCLFINGCGRTDFQTGSSERMWNSVQNRLFELPKDTLVYPGHDYNQRRVSTIQQEIDLNPRFKDQTKESFIELMNNLGLDDPKYMDKAIPANKKCGLE